MTLKFSQTSKTAPEPVDLTEARPGDTFLDRTDGSIAVFVAAAKPLIWFYPADTYSPVLLGSLVAREMVSYALKNFTPCDLELLVTPR